MAQVTVELRHLLKTDFKLFDFEYQFDDINFKKQLEEHIISYFYDYEIGQETPEMFKRKFITRWKRIIPYYNELYNTSLLEYSPLTNYSIKEAIEELSEVSRSSNSSSTASARGTTNNEDENIISSEDSSNTKKSDYPQQAITTGSYLSDESTTDNLSNSTTNTTSLTTSSDSSDSTNTSSSTDNSNRTYEKTIEGITGVTYQELIRQQRDNILRIPDMVAREMKPCFVLVY